MGDWATFVAVLGVAAVISLANYLGLRGSFAPRQRGGEGMPQAYRVMEASLSSQAARLDAQARRMDELEAEIAAQRAKHVAEMSALREELEEAYRGIKVLMEQLGEAGIVPGWKPAAKVAAKKGGGGGPSLATLIVAAFSRDEIDGLAFDVGIDPESLGGETKATRARELVTAARQQGRLERLVEVCREFRPDGGF